MPPEHDSPQTEGQFHDYSGNEIPWYVRTIWIGFWIFVVYYTVMYLFPALEREHFQRP